MTNANKTNRNTIPLQIPTQCLFRRPIPIPGFLWILCRRRRLSFEQAFSYAGGIVTIA